MKTDSSLNTSEYPYIFTSKGFEKHLTILESLPYTKGNSTQCK